MSAKLFSELKLLLDNLHDSSIQISVNFHFRCKQVPKAFWRAKALKTYNLENQNVSSNMHMQSVVD